MPWPACRRRQRVRTWRETPARCRYRCRRSRRPPAPLCLRNRARSFPSLPSCFTRLRIGAGHVNWPLIVRGTLMPEFRELSRSVKGLTVLVTGAASGMGRATARVFAAEGANVAVTDISADGIAAVSDAITSCGGSAHAWTLDVADPDRIRTVVSDVAAHFGSLDIIVNNAGISVSTAIDQDGYDAAWDRAIAVMLTSHQRIIRAALPHLRKSTSPRIVNIASTEALGATAL